MDCECAFGCAPEREMDLQSWYKKKDYQLFSDAVWSVAHNKTDFKPNELGFEFANMGMILLNSKYFLPYLKGQTWGNLLNVQSSRTLWMVWVHGSGQQIRLY